MSKMRIPNPQPGDCHEYFFRYLRLVRPGEAGSRLVDQLQEVTSIFERLADAESLKVTPPYTWNLRQVLGHLVDVERVFGYRAARLAAGDTVSLPGFDQDKMVEGMQYQSVAINVLLEEWVHLRQANLKMIAHFQDEQYARRGSVDGHTMTTAAAVGILAGHVDHHLPIIRKRLGL